jgi:hypothetical protein
MGPSTGSFTENLTPEREVDIFRGFREYPEPAVKKRLGDRLKCMAFAILDTRDVPQGSAGLQRSNRLLCGGFTPIYRACDTLLPEQQRDPMRTGYVGRDSETELGG